MVARVEDCFLGKEPGFGPSSQKLSSPWRWSQGAGSRQLGVPRDFGGDPLQHNGSSFFDASKSGVLPTWTKGLHNVPGSGTGHGHHPGSVQPHNNTNNNSIGTESHDQNEGILTSFASSYLTALQQLPGRAGVVVHTTTALAPAGNLARNPSFESINNTTTGSCSTPSFCVGSPVTVFPSRPSDSGSNNKLGMQQLAAFSESRVVQAHVHAQSQLSDNHYLSNDSLSYGSMEADRDAIVNCVVDDFWTPGEALQLPEFRFEPMLDDTADTGACSGLAFSVGELDSLVSTNHGSSRSSMITPAAPDFCQSFFAGAVDEVTENKPVVNKPTQIAIPTRGTGFNATADHHSGGGRLRWSDEPWRGTFSYPPSEKSPTSLAGSSPSSPTTPLDPHLFASSKLTEFTATSNKRSFATMQSTASAVVATEKAAAADAALPNADKFDAAALSALLYSNTQSNNNNHAYSFKDNNTTYPTTTTSAPVPKQRRRHGTATDPQSIAARTRREKFTDRIRVLQSLVPNGERLDTVHMLSQTFEYVRFLQHKVWDLYNGKDSLAEVKCEKWKEFVDTTTGQVLV